MLDIQGTSTETQIPEAQTPGPTQIRPDSPWRPRYPCRPHSPWKTYPLVKDTVLQTIRQETPSPGSVGCCIPRSKEPLIPWGGFGTEEALTEFLDDVFDENGEYCHPEKCDDCDRVKLSPYIASNTNHSDPIKEMERYIHNITDADDLDTIESKHDHNSALMNNTELQIIHEGIKHELDKEKLEKLKEEYDPSSEIILESNWHTDDDFDEETEENNDKIVKKLYEDLANLAIEDSNEDSSIKKTEDDPVAAAKCPPILGGRCHLKAVPLGWRDT